MNKEELQKYLDAYKRMSAQSFSHTFSNDTHKPDEPMAKIIFADVELEVPFSAVDDAVYETLEYIAEDMGLYVNLTTGGIIEDEDTDVEDPLDLDFDDAAGETNSLILTDLPDKKVKLIIHQFPDGSGPFEETYNSLREAEHEIEETYLALDWDADVAEDIWYAALAQLRAGEFDDETDDMYVIEIN